MVEYEPILMNVLSIDEDEARILLLLIIQGGFTKKEAFFEHLSITRPTLIKKINALIEKGLIRQNEEFNPIRITLSLNPFGLKNRFVQRKNNAKNAHEFILKSQAIKNKDLIRERFKNAINVLKTPHRYKNILLEIITILYIDQEDSNNIISLKNLKIELEKVEIDLSESFLFNFLSSIPNIFHIVSIRPLSEEQGQKTRKRKLIRPFYSLEAFSEFLFLENQYYHSYCSERIEFLFNNYENLSNDLSPHQLLPFLSNIKRRLRSCLNFYSQIYILHNGVSGMKVNELLQMLIRSSNFSKHHIISIYSDEEIDFPNMTRLKINIKKLPDQIGKDYRERDIILFCRELNEPYGALVFPMKPLTPYYTITTYALRMMKEFFLKFWGA